MLRSLPKHYLQEGRSAQRQEWEKEMKKCVNRMADGGRLWKPITRKDMGDTQIGTTAMREQMVRLLIFSKQGESLGRYQTFVISCSRLFNGG